VNDGARELVEFPLKNPLEKKKRSATDADKPHGEQTKPGIPPGNQVQVRRVEDRAGKKTVQASQQSDPRTVNQLING
jgi:hypothetical protein